MFDKKPILAIVANKLSHDSRDKLLSEYKVTVMAKINEATEFGKFECYINRINCPEGSWEEILDQLKSLGYVMNRKCGELGVWIKWDDDSIANYKAKNERRK